MMEFIGFDPDNVKEEVEHIVEDMIDQYNRYDHDFENLFSGLYYSWSSPNAVEFDKTHRPICTNLLEEIRRYYFEFIADIKNAVNAIAESNGVTGYGSYLEFCTGLLETINYSRLDNVPALLEDRDGNIGMDINKTLEIKTRFENGSMKWIHEEIAANQPTVHVYDIEMSLYDPDGSMNTAYKSRAMGLTNKLNELFNNIKKALNGAIEEEQQRIQEAKTNATDTLAN